MDLSVVVPCLNEEGNVPLLRYRLLPVLDGLGVDYELLCIDDGSSDRTPDRLEALRRDLPRVRMARHPRNLGMGAALRTGFAAAQGDWVLTTDADCTFPPEEIPQLWENRHRADCLIGSPFLGRCEGVSWKRRLPSLILNRSYSLLFDRRLTAYTPLLRLYRGPLIRALSFEADGFEANAEILCRMLQAGARVVEMPVTLRRRAWGESKLRRFRELGRHLRLVWRLKTCAH